MVKFRTPKICEPSVWILLHVSNLTPKILRWLLDFWNICSPLANVSSTDALTKIMHFFPPQNIYGLRVIPKITALLSINIFIIQSCTIL